MRDFPCRKSCVLLLTVVRAQSKARSPSLQSCEAVVKSGAPPDRIPHEASQAAWNRIGFRDERPAGLTPRLFLTGIEWIFIGVVYPVGEENKPTVPAHTDMSYSEGINDFQGHFKANWMRRTVVSKIFNSPASTFCRFLVAISARSASAS
jgi:hypothetical protein